jgi:hypothetical protein
MVHSLQTQCAAVANFAQAERLEVVGEYAAVETGNDSWPEVVSDDSVRAQRRLGPG